MPLDALPALTGDPPDLDAIAILITIYDAGGSAPSNVIPFPNAAPSPGAAPAAPFRTVMPRATAMTDDFATPEAAPEAAECGAEEFDRIVRANLDDGVNASLVQCLVRFLQDPRPEARHRHVMAEVVRAISGRTAMAFPGNAHLIASVTGWANGVRQRYSASTIKSTLSDLTGWGFLHSARRAPPSGGRAIAHYTAGRPRDLEAAIEAHFLKERAKAAEKTAKVHAGVNLRNGVNPEVKVHPHINLSDPKVYAGIPAEVYARVSRAVEEPLEEPVVGAAPPLPLAKVEALTAPIADAPPPRAKKANTAQQKGRDAVLPEDARAAIDAWNSAATAHGWCPVTTAWTPKDVGILSATVRRVGGIDVFRAALGVAGRSWLRSKGLEATLTKFIHSSYQLSTFADQAKASGAGASFETQDEAWVAAEMQKPDRRRQIAREGDEKVRAYLTDLRRKMLEGGRG